MNKTIKFMSLAVAAMGMAACSSEDVLEGNNPVQAEWNGNGTGYLAVNLNLPSTKGNGGMGVKKLANDVFDKGDAGEYAVNDVMLVLFKGADEASSTYVRVVELDNDGFGAAANGNVTLDRLYVKEIPSMAKDASEKFYALAVVNHNDVFKYAGGTLTIGGTEISSATKFSDIQNIIASTNLHAEEFYSDKTNKTNFLMLNAPLWSIAGGDNEPTSGTLETLVDVTGSIKATESEAREAGAASIYVERAVAKVTVEGATTKQTGEKFDWALNNWGLDNTNTQSYVVRHMNQGDDFNFASIVNLRSFSADAQNYRMVGSTTTKHSSAISQGAKDDKDHYRTYFAYDPNYDKVGTFNKLGDALTYNFGTDHPYYCAENTFNVKHQIWSQTTRVLVSATLTPKEDECLYAKPGDEKFMSKDAIEHLAFTFVTAQFGDMITNGLITGSAAHGSSTFNFFDNEDKINVVVGGLTAADLTDEQVAAKNVDDPSRSGHKLTTKDEVTAALNHTYVVTGANIGGYKHYNGGKSYYQVRIKHFGDDLTPWNTNEYDAAHKPVAGGIDASYPNNDRREGNYLGRYGVLRNNWYDLNISKITKIGYATSAELNLDGTDGGTPDDYIKEEQWINVEVNILSWAKRTQSVEL